MREISQGSMMKIAVFLVVIFQMLVIYFWHELRYFTIVNLIILGGITVRYARICFFSICQNDVKSGLHQNAYFGNADLTEADIVNLPELIKKYLHFTGSFGKPKVNNFKVEFTGKIRKNEQTEWMPFTAEQYSFMEIPTRLFFMKAVMKGLPVAGYHCFKNGTAVMDIRLFSLFKVQYQDGPEMDLSETVTFFNDMCCLAPATLIDKRITWLEVNGNQVKASFTNNHITVSAWLHFNDEGALINFISEERYSADAGKRLPWATPLKNYRQINGYNLVSNAEAIYSYPDRDLCYGTFTVTGVTYNCTDLYPINK